ncbi:hypothetical protein KEF29_11690 [Streptomyces tuirus]|uniref:Secreted protein n=1 Tax=Streptomyces tuirus TaxID=68278 RepID=A0A941FBN2_9ACTN|nr:hypothetical protein [Streptomyces tuirus]
MVSLLACLLLLPLVVPALGYGGPAAEVAVTAAVDVAVVQTAAASGTEAQGAGEPCPCENEPSVRQPGARTPRAAGAAGASSVVTAAPGVDRGGTGIREAGTGRRTGAVASAPDAVELQTFRC